MHPTRNHRLLVGLLLVLTAFATACSPEALDFTIGECVNLPDGPEVSEFESVDCNTVHDAEVFALPQFPAAEDAAFPGQSDVQTFSEERCIEEFQGYVGSVYDTSELYATQLVPTMESWDQAADREVVCLLVGAPIEDETGEVRQPVTYDQLIGVKRDSSE